MNSHKGFALVITLLIALGIIVLGGAGYVAMNPEVLESLPGQSAPGDHPEVDQEGDEGTADSKSSISWRVTSAGEINGMPYTNVAVVVNGTVYEMGKFAGSCSEVGASGGIDSKGLLAGELSAMQCWFAGSGDEIGVFAHEDGGFDIMVGGLSEGEEGAGMFRGDFSIKNTIEL